MRFLVDRCAGVTLAKWLRDQGHDVDDAGEWPQDPGDFSDLLARHEADLAAHAVITVSGGRVRISRPQKPEG